MSIFFKSFLVLVAGLLLTISVSAQSLTGQWVGLWRTLDNGEKDRMFLDLQQTGDHVAGTVTTIGHSWTVHGSVTTLVNGVHTEIFLSPRDKQPRLVGDLADNELHLIRDGASFTAKPGSSSDQYPTIQFISPPALDSVPGNGLAARPPMGWNSWNLFESRIDDKTVREMADALVTTGMRDAGYVYVNIDDTWEGIRDAQGQLSSNQKFPDMKSLANYLHSRGLKLGIYSSPGERTCAEYPGSYGHEDQDAKTFAAWGIDYLKYDWCGARMIYTADDLRAVYQTMGRSLLKAGRPMVYSLCEYGDGHVETWGVAVGANLWRTTGDIKDSWASMIANIEKQAPLAGYAGPGHWNDPDMLEIGNGHMTDNEYRTHMTLWAIAAAPLLAGNDIRSMTPQIKAILTNKEVLDVDQDPLGKQAVPSKIGDLELWKKLLADGSVAVALVNLTDHDLTAHLSKADLGVAGNVRSARDLWTHSLVGIQKGVLTAKIASHGVVFVRIPPGNK